MRSMVLACLVAGLAVAAGAPPALAASADCHAPRSWVAGTVDLCEGTLYYRDYVYDDYGADDPLVPAQTRPTTGSLSRPAGDARYTEDVNSADLVDLALRIAGDRVEVAFELNALFSPDSTVAALAIDTDGDRSTGGGPWKNDVHDFGITSDGWEVLAFFDRGDPGSNVITGSLPLPEGASWRVQAATAVNGGPVMNVAFRGPDERTVVGTWWEDKQAAALAAGDVSAFGHTVEVADLHNGVTRLADPGAGLRQRVFTSRYTLPPGEGMSYTPIYGRHGNASSVCEQQFHFFGRYQPYGIYVPKTGAAPRGVQFALHGCNANHASLIDQPGMQQQLGEDLNRIIVNPLGRGPVGFYSDISERDVLEVLDDVLANYPVDRDRIVMGGYSMGGYGAFRFSMLYPDLFAGFISWVGFTGDCANAPGGVRLERCPAGGIGNVIHSVGNLRHVPGVMLYAGADELVHVNSAVAMEEEFRRQEVPYVWYLHPVADHFTFALADEWGKEAENSRAFVRVRRPTRVSYRTDPALAYPEWGISHDRAYWVSEITARGEGFADVDATTHACGGSVPTYTTSSGAGARPVPWVSSARVASGAVAVTPADRFEATLANVASFTVDADEACVRGRTVAYRVTTDGPLAIAFSDGRSLSFHAAGIHQGVLHAGTAGAAAGAAAVTPGRSLPATGGPAALPLAGLLALLVAARLRAER